MDRLHGQTGGADGQRVQERGGAVERDHLDAPGSEVERHASGPRADVEHPTAGVVSERAPQRQVLAVAAALEVVPDGVEIQLKRARSSSSRRASSALRAGPPAAAAGAAAARAAVRRRQRGRVTARIAIPAMSSAGGRM